LFEQDTGHRSSLNHEGGSQVDSDLGSVSDAQGIGLAMTMNDFDESLSHASLHELEKDKASSTNLTPIDSDVLEHLGRDVTLQCGSSYAIHAGTFVRHEKGTSTQSDSLSESGSRSSYSYERPKSQANTASRLVPPTAPKHSVVPKDGDFPEDIINDDLFEGFHASSPEYMPPPDLPAETQAHGNREALRKGDSPDPLKAPSAERSKKRKDFTDHDNSAVKRLRQSSKLQSRDQTPTSKNQFQSSSKPSIEGSCKNSGRESSQISTKSSAVSRSQARHGASEVAPRMPNQDSSGRAHRSRGQNAPRFSARVTSSHHSTRSKSMFQSLHKLS